MTIPKTKLCSKCGEEKPLDEFYRAKKGLYGRYSQCKKCKNAYTLNRVRSSPELQEQARQRASKWYSENTEHTLERVRKYAEENREEILEKHRDYWHNKVDKEAYKKQRNKRRRELYRTDPEFRERRKQDGRHSAKIRKARLKGAEGSYTQQEWQALCESYGHTCLRCGQKKPLTVDHVVPVSKGGANTIDNIQPLCGPCNSKKNNKTIDYRPSWGKSEPAPRWTQKPLL